MGGTHKFPFLPHQNTISQIGRKYERKVAKNIWIKLPLTRHSYCLPHFFFPFLFLFSLTGRIFYFSMIHVQHTLPFFCTFSFYFLFFNFLFLTRHEFSFLINLGNCIFFFGWLVQFFFFLNWESFLIKEIWVNLYKLYFLSSHFSSQPNKKIFYPSTFPSF